MKSFAAVLVVLAFSGCATSGGSASPRIDARAAFELLRGVEGDWSGEVVEGTGAGDHPVEGRYHVTAGGSVVQATLFRGTPRETVMMFHLDDGELMLTQYDEAGNSARLVADWSGPAFLDPAGPNPSAEPDGAGIRFSLARATHHVRSGDEYLHDVVLLILKDGTETVWRFYRDGASSRDVYVELTQKDSPRTVADSRLKGH